MDRVVYAEGRKRRKQNGYFLSASHSVNKRIREHDMEYYIPTQRRKISIRKKSKRKNSSFYLMFIIIIIIIIIII